jgi:carbohydrate-binding DOMON domain-containing protein
MATKAEIARGEGVESIVPLRGAMAGSFTVSSRDDYRVECSRRTAGNTAGGTALISRWSEPRLLDARGAPGVAGRSGLAMMKAEIAAGEKPR